MVVTCFPDITSNNEVVTYIDNMGTCVFYQKGYDLRCSVTSSLLQQTEVVARGLNMVAPVQKVTRCSSLGPTLADMLSKGKMEEFNQLWPVGGGRELLQRRVPVPLLRWMKKPEVDHNLGRKILTWMVMNGTAPAVALGQPGGNGGTELDMLTVFDV